VTQNRLVQSHVGKQEGLRDANVTKPRLGPFSGLYQMLFESLQSNSKISKSGGEPPQ